MARIAKSAEQFDPVHAGQVGIDHKACFAAWTICLEEVLASRIILDDPAILLEHAADSLADVTVVINDEDNGRLVAPASPHRCAEACTCAADRRADRRRWIVRVNSGNLTGLFS